MIKIKVDYQGFKLGIRVGDQLGLIANIKSQGDIQALHKLKNQVTMIETMREFGAFGINGVTYGR